MRNVCSGILVLCALLGPGASPLAQEAAEDAVLLVATSALNESSYRKTVILSVPIDGDRHIGIILNRPSGRKLADLFPEHGPSKQVADPVFFGGPMTPRAVFALVRSAESPGRGSLRIADGLFLAMTANTVDWVIEQQPKAARFYVGDVIWRPGELREELGDSYWHVISLDPDLLFRKDTQGLWDELSRLAHSLRASAGDALTDGLTDGLTGGLHIARLQR
jgi:putative AlgH/UPF0301 family transcriptional regulator